MPQVKTGTAWTETYARCRAVAPEAFAEDHLENLVARGRVALGAAARPSGRHSRTGPRPACPRLQAPKGGEVCT